MKTTYASKNKKKAEVVRQVRSVLENGQVVEVTFLQITKCVVLSKVQLMHLVCPICIHGIEYKRGIHYTLKSGVETDKNKDLISG